MADKSSTAHEQPLNNAIQTASTDLAEIVSEALPSGTQESDEFQDSCTLVDHRSVLNPAGENGGHYECTLTYTENVRIPDSLDKVAIDTEQYLLENGWYLCFGERRPANVEPVSLIESYETHTDSTTPYATACYSKGGYTLFITPSLVSEEKDVNLEFTISYIYVNSIVNRERQK